MIRFTAPRTQRSFSWPARHQAGASADPALPPMGAVFRLKPGTALSRFSGAARIVADAMVRHGISLGDNGSSWYLSGAPDPRWDNDVLHELDVLAGSDFEAVDVSSLMISPDSAQRRTCFHRDLTPERVTEPCRSEAGAPEEFNRPPDHCGQVGVIRLEVDGLGFEPVHEPRVVVLVGRQSSRLAECTGALSGRSLGGLQLFGQLVKWVLGGRFVAHMIQGTQGTPGQRSRSSGRHGRPRS